MGRIGTHAARATVLGAGIAAVAIAAANATAAGSHPPTLSASKHVAGLPAVTYGQSIKLSGHESNAGTKTIVLQANAFPFTSSFHTVGQEQTHGTYSFTERPNRATQYRTYVKGTSGSTSQVVTVYVLEQGMTTSCNLCGFHNSPGAHVLVLSGRFRPVGGRGPFYFYYGQANGSTVPPHTLRLVKTVAAQVGSGSVSFNVSYHVDFPSGPFRFQYVTCRQDNEAHDGFGLPGHHHCGDPTVTTSEYTG